MLNRRLGREHDTLHRIHHHNSTISDTDTGGNLVDKVDVTGRVDQVDEVALALGGGENERHGSRLDGDEAGLGEGVGVGVAELSYS